MIAVIADDFTGAAEIGGIGLRYGLKVVIETEPFEQPDVDILVIATDTRSLNGEEASAQISRITRDLMKIRPELIFKKIDSALRGNIVEELAAQMKTSGKKRGVIIPANPVFNRIIKDGRYFIDGVSLEKTLFSADPNYPVKSPVVVEVLRSSKNFLLSSMKPDEELPALGLVVGDVVNKDDLSKWADKIDESVLPAGASGFFDAILAKKYNTAPRNGSPTEFFEDKTLFVLGSSFPKNADFLKTIREKGFYLSNMPEAIYYNTNYRPELIDQWADEVSSALEKKRRVIVAIRHARNEGEPDLEFRISRIVGDLVKKVVALDKIKDLALEGGSTTFMVLQALGIKKLIPVQELDTGIIRMKAHEIPELYITTKPGSYAWPDHLWTSGKPRGIGI